MAMKTRLVPATRSMAPIMHFSNMHWMTQLQTVLLATAFWDDVHTFRDVVGDERGHADAEIDIVAVAEFECDAAGDAFAFLVFGQRHKEISVVSFQFQVNPKAKTPV